MIKLISFIVFTHFFPISMNLKFEGNQVTYYFKLKQQYFFLQILKVNAKIYSCNIIIFTFLQELIAIGKLAKYCPLQLNHSSDFKHLILAFQHTIF